MRSHISCNLIMSSETQMSVPLYKYRKEKREKSTLYERDKQPVSVPPAFNLSNTISFLSTSDTDVFETGEIKFNNFTRLIFIFSLKTRIYSMTYFVFVIARKQISNRCFEDENKLTNIR